MTVYQYNSAKPPLHKPRFKLLLVLVGISLVSCGSPPATPAPATLASTDAPATATPAPTLGPTMEPGDADHSVTVDGQDRSYVLHIPPGVPESAPVPVVIVLHETTYTVSQMRSMTDFDDLADQNGIVLIYPRGFGTAWNGGGCCGLPVKDNVDDIKFVQKILSDLEPVITVDSNRIYAAGLGNGAIMAYRLACELSGTFSGIAAVQGPLFYEECQPDNPVAVLHVHGLNNPIFPFSGGESIEGGIPILPPVEQGISQWVEWNGCSGSPDVNTSGSVTHTVYSGCQANAVVELYTIDGLEYGWPAPAGSGEANFPATQTIWDFFVEHTRQ